MANSCSTMHKIQEKEFTLEDFSCEHLTSWSLAKFRSVLEFLNIYIETHICMAEKTYWRMEQLSNISQKIKIFGGR